MTPALQTLGLTHHFGAFLATDNVNISLPPGARHALIGPNGAGKTTLVNLLTGVLRPGAGRILMGGEEVTGMAQDRRVRRGLSRTFQINQLFPELTPLQSVSLAVARRMELDGGWWRPLGHGGAVAKEAAEILGRFGLSDAMGRRVGDLPYGRQRLLEVALAIAARPRVLLLDEPAAGVPEAEREDILAAIRALPREVAVLLIEHDMDLVFRFAESITVLVSGAVLMEGTPAEVAADPRVRAVYLGEGGHD
ncbi:ABC transporter ATP-binding protein [Roseomonas populi]|uniref:ABC transporter ATP-binding protein n=1 Tax=Roseomonas populi TaxID=3121582 RepID=A0ABT1WZ69_9PROT|nr:ABC transporter ATP-binding protein [Roseomonas pecuniae]MCR0981119.1 ABC transporter ATP-binding protein [Roseomonas pecuniae]